MYKNILFLFLLTALSASAQVVYEPLNSDIYQYLSRLSQRGVISFDDNILPLSRKYLAERLTAVIEHKNALTPLEIEELAFYEKEFGLELKMLSGGSFQEQSTFLEDDLYNRKRFFAYESELFKTNFDLLLSTEQGMLYEERFESYSNGFEVYGYLTEHLGFSLQWYDNYIEGETIDPYRSFTPEQGFVPHTRSETHASFNRVKTTIGIDWDWGSAAIGKDNIEMGYGEGGKLVLSSRPPSYPYIRLDIKPADWIRFNYLHSWLHSNVIDSIYSYPANVDGTYRFLTVDKFLASHSFIFTPFEGFDFTLGESIVYSDRLEISYLMPLMFFRLADHYLSLARNDIGDNAQWFFSISSKNHIPNTHLYSTLFLDEFTLSNAFDSEEQRNQLGFTVGGSVTDLPLPNLTTCLEFTRIYPFVYEHFIPSITYKSNYYPLGHWIEHNSDQVYGSLTYRIIRGLKVKLWGQYIRRGERGEAIQQYTQPQPPFLFGLRSMFQYLGADIQYEIFHDFFLRGKFTDLTSTYEQADGTEYELSIQEFSLFVSFGL